ncbi:sulfotransferase 1B1-like isoform X1 [Saccostrea echinata]|uniref:sulfotransferase 1B1-like isoform X1 n=1 Tax=Saccostrea echinata TaxID=191078 RepID=UPI002A8092C9|nr:sulfotransferase 1B1-like isoform X1 [Saccostrea echinata]XP_061180043.1 sulfotransferase 1B1-like isoform X1 [Saccostrea echinata]
MYKPLPRCPNGMLLPPLDGYLRNATQRLKDIQHLQTREEDILVSSYPKSGSHWLHEILCRLLHNQEAKFPRMELTFLDLLSNLSHMDSLPSPRILYTHLPVHFLPEDHIKNGRKIVHIVRDPRDIAVSAYYHFLNEPLFRGYMYMTTDWNEHLSNFMSGNFIYGEWCQYELQWEKFYKSGNVLVLRYEEMKADEVECVRKIAEYLSIPCDKETASRIASECNIFKVRERKKSRIFGYLYRKGEVGDWKNHFSSTQQEKFSLLFKERLRDSSLSTYFQ